MTPIEFERRYAPTWDRLDALLGWLDVKKARLPDQHWNAESIPPLYREVCHHLALARDRGYPAYLVTRLNGLVQRAHQVLYRPRTRFWTLAWRYFSLEFPALLRANRGLMLIAAAAFALPLVVMGLLVYFLPELIYSLMPPEAVAQMERMYNPSGSVIGRERAGDSDFLMFGHYIRNNIGVSFQCFASGLLFGVGSLFYLILNGLMIGALSGYLTQLGYSETFWSFVCGHGSFELTAIAISGGCGLKLGFALLAPGPLTRRAALVAAAREAARIMYGVVVMLVIAAFIEAFWSSSRWIPNEVKYGVAALLWTLVIYYCVHQGKPARTGRGRDE
ncbi:MAG: stage II sporulation protein M [Betaproteobacteria bacterium]|nr:stage II sporulation protein M [Betaproteobacteria bacterium]